MMTPLGQSPSLRDDLIEQQTMILDQREANAQMVKATLLAQELTERAEAAQARAEAMTRALRDSEERYRILFDLCPAAVYACDSSGVIQNFNRRAAELWGREPAPGDPNERFCGSFKLFRPDGSFVPREQCPTAEVLNGTLSEARGAELLIERPGGTRVNVVMNIRPLKDERGEVTGAINCTYDITDRKNVENQLATSLSRERELAQFREMFIGILGHDLRAPLASIILTAEAQLRRGDIAGQDGGSSERIIRSGERMNRMVTKVLDLTSARLGGGLLIVPKPTDLREICRNVVEEFGATIQLQVEGDLTGIWDQDRLAQALSNLARNAIEYRAPGTVMIVKAHADGDEVVVEIINYGEPIPSDVLPFIFEPFRRAQQREKSATGNLGLGLYIAHQIVQSHGGTLDAHSADGTTTFVMRLPRIAPPPPAGPVGLTANPR